MTLTHYCGSFIIEAKNTYLNGGNSIQEGKSKVSMPKSFENKAGVRIPYISAQCWRRWWSESFRYETKRNTSQTSKVNYQNKKLLSPIDDIFGYYLGLNQKLGLDEVNDVNIAQIRSSPLQLTNLMPIKSQLTNKYLSLDKAFIHLKRDTSLPYSSRFYTAYLESIFGIDVNRICSYKNFNDRIELSDDSIKEYLETEYLHRINEHEYQLSNYVTERKNRIRILLKSLLTISGGAKLTQYGCDISPKILLIAGQKGGNPILTNCFEKGLENVRIIYHKLIDKITNFSYLFDTPIFLGIRKGIIENPEKIDEIKSIIEKETNLELVIDSPGNIIKRITEDY